MVGLGDHGISGQRHHRVKIVCGQCVRQVPVVIGMVAAQQGEISADRAFKDEAFPIDLNNLLVLFD